MVKRLKKYKLLIAEDNLDTLIEITQYFGRYFLSVFQAKDGKQALDIFEQEAPDVLLLDIAMPNITGLELAKKIRQQNKTIPIIILSAYSDREVLLTAVELNLLQFIIKPLSRKNAQELLLKLDNHFKKANQYVINSEISYNYDYKSIIFEDKTSIYLTKKETQLLESLISNNNKPVNSETLTNIIYDNDAPANYNARLKVLIHNLKRKIPALPIHNKYGLGYLLQT